MKFLISIIIIFSLCLKSEEKLDSIYNKTPEKLNKFEFKFPEYKLDFLANGIKLYLVPDDSQKITNIRVLLGSEEIYRNVKPASLELLSGMMLKGTTTKKAVEISEAVDFYGANLSFSYSDDYITLNINVLNQYLDEVLAILDDVLFNTKFDKNELNKLKKQYIAALVSEKSDPGSLASKLSKKVIYGENDSYAQFPNEKDIENIEIDDLNKLKSQLFQSNNISLGIYGYYNDNDLKNIYNVFGKYPKVNLDDEQENQTTNSFSYVPGVYFIEREGSVQSSIRVISPAPKLADKDYEKVQFASNIIGSGFIGRLFKILREKHSYTYSPSASVSGRKNFNYFSANADVKQEVTDSAIVEMLNIINDMRQNDVSNNELEAAKNFKIGNYYMAFENSDYTISLIQNSEFKGKRAKQLESFDSRIKAMDAFEIKNVVNKYLAENLISIVVVGPKSVKDKLKAFGNVIEYDKDIKPVNDFAKVNMEYDDIFEDFLESIGGDDIFDDVTSLKSEGEIKLNIQGQEINGEYLELMSKYQNKYSMQDLKVNKQESVVKEGKSYTLVNGKGIEEERKAFDKYDYTYFNFAKIKNKDFNIKVLGKRNHRIFVEVSASKEKRVYQFDDKTFRLLEFTTTQESPIGTIVYTTSYDNYTKIGDYFYPTLIKVNSSMFNSELNVKYEINPKIEASKFDI